MSNITKKERVKWRVGSGLDAKFEYAPGYFWNDGTQPRGPYRSYESAEEAWLREQGPETEEVMNEDFEVIGEIQTNRFCDHIWIDGNKYVKED